MAYINLIPLHITEITKGDANSAMYDKTSKLTQLYKFICAQHYIKAIS